MNGVHDMGGMHGFGPVHLEASEPLFHAAWERRALGLTLAMGATGQWNIDQSRSARESLPPAAYLGSGYYRIWILGLEQLLRQRGLVTADELATGHLTAPAQPVARVLQSTNVDAALARGTATERAAATPARFAVGQQVRAVNRHPAGHTRLPRYVRGHIGTVERVHGVHVFADRHAASAPGQPFDEAPQWLYAVAFDGQELWGTDAEPGLRVSVDAWESYLEPASAGTP
ncbi:MAG: nitrile hydratase subunit beta [Betaproteobacteria bacterium]|jgi:nitrile hydratase